MKETFERLRAALADRYRLEAKIGEGGMAEVYLGMDLRHGRRVAVKVLRPELSAVVGAERFLQEIAVTAHLQHPHILPLYDSGAADGLLYYVMPYIEGESLRSRLARERQLPVEEAITLLRLLAAALDYAHRQGVVHRDIKPENILLHEGQPLIADFGVALALSQAGGDRLTRTGLSVGTPQYMSPEQAAGEAQIDRRADVYALGCVAYEMLAGVPPHSGPTAQAVLASTLTVRAPRLTAVRHTVPEPVAAAVDRALEKLPADRYPTAAQFAEALGRSDTPVAIPALAWRGGARPWLLAISAIAGVVLGGLGGWAIFGGRSPMTEASRHWNLVLPEPMPLALTGPGPLGVWQSALALSRDGGTLAYIAPAGGTTRLVVRRLDGDSGLAIPGSDGAYHPFFSPDGTWIGFFAGDELRKVRATGGSPISVAKVDRPVGAAWSTTDRLLLLENDGFDLRWVPASGGSGGTRTSLATQFGAPDLLPGERWAVGQLSSGQLALLSLDDGTLLAVSRRGVIPMDSVRQLDLLFGASPKWLPSGHLVFGTGDGVLAALPFDAATRRVAGQPVPVAAGVRIEEGFGFTEYAISEDGTLVFAPGANQSYGRIAFLGAEGKLDTLPFPRGWYTQLRFSPRGGELAVQVRGELQSGEVQVLDLVSGQRRRIDVPGHHRTFPASWSPDGRELLIGVWDPVRFLNRGARLYSLAGAPLRDIGIAGASYMTIAPNGRDLAYSDWRTGELFIRPLFGDTAATQIPGRGFAATFSPDGRWLAYGATDGGVAVSPIPPTGAVFRVVERGQQPLWSPRGDRIIYRDGRQFLEVAVSAIDGVRAGPPRLIAEGPFVRTFAWNQSIAADGRIATVVALPDRSLRTLHVVTGFFEELRRAAPPERR